MIYGLWRESRYRIDQKARENARNPFRRKRTETMNSTTTPETKTTSFKTKLNVLDAIDALERVRNELDRKDLVVKGENVSAKLINLCKNIVESYSKQNSAKRGKTNVANQ